ncbi:MAG: 4a-hydroxytetrahydrobiopterin dehydratase [Candidatus Nanopelagicales bacterium]
MARPRPLDAEEVGRQLEALAAWTGDVDRISRSLQFPDFRTAIRGVDEIAEVAEEMDHHPDLDIRWRTVHVVLSTHDAGGVTQLDIEQAHRIDEIARQLGAT